MILAAPVSAETFDVSLGSKTLGKLSYSTNGNKSTLSSVLDNTPMGVFNGAFTGTSTGFTNSSIFVGDSRSSRKQRVVTVEIVKGKAVSTDVVPLNEQTDLSDIARVPSQIIDPIRAIGLIINAKGCPANARLYDGRRVVTLHLKSHARSGDTLTCDISYRVSDGPGHLSPLRISSAKMHLNYDVIGDAQTLRQIKISSGIFRLSLNSRRD